MKQAIHSEDLSDLPIDAPIEIDGATVCLQLRNGGAVLSAELAAQSGPASIKRCLELGFSNALEFEAGLALDTERQRLVLTHWLAGVSDWDGAATALELLLNQVDVCRAVSNEQRQQAPKGFSRRSMEQQLRSQLAR
jgi:hypothetical protein